MNKEKMETDEQLVMRIKNDKELFREIIRRYEKKLFSYAYYLTGRKADSADIVQEVFIKSYINLNGFDTKKKFSSWIYRITHNQAVNFLKKNSKSVPYNDKLDSKSNIDLEGDLMKKEMKKTIESCLGKIPVSYREVVTLYYFEHLSYKEISDILQMPENTVATRLSRAKNYLKVLCEKEKI